MKHGSRMKGCCSLCGRYNCNGNKNVGVARTARKAVGLKRKVAAAMKDQDGWD